MSEENTILLLNEDAERVKELFHNPGISLKKIFNNVYSVFINDVELNIIIKCYDTKYHAKKEVENLSKLTSCKGVPKIMSYGLGKKLKYIVMSKIEGVDLCEYIKTNSLTEDELKNITIQLLKIIRRLHNKNIIHGDIKPENIIYNTETKKIYLIDFEGKFTSGYCSPEQVKNMIVTDKTDLWSLGVTLYTIFNNAVLFDTNRDVLNEKIIFSTKGSYELQDFLECIIQRNIDLRYDTDEALEHIWLQ
jgi:serine/threonine protein kinase